MFTGIITAVGTVESIVPLDAGLKIRIASSYDYSTIDLGASIACNGICLTVVGTFIEDSSFEVEAWEEAVRLTTLSTWQKGTKINLERSLKLGQELGGHLVSGHIDGQAQIVDIKNEGAARRFYFKAPTELLPFIAKKGSVALDGISLTVNSVNEDVFDVLLIDHSLKVTTFADKKLGDYANIEVDQLARYCLRHREIQQRI